MPSPHALQASWPQPALRVLPAPARVVGAVQGKREGGRPRGRAVAGQGLLCRLDRMGPTGIQSTNHERYSWLDRLSNLLPLALFSGSHEA